MLPISILQTAVGHPILVELKNGQTYNGHLESCDFAMNLLLREVIQTSVDGERFWRWSEMNVLDKAREKSLENRNNLKGEDRDKNRKPRGRGRGRGRGR
ncbi:hypothetical protein BB561_003314 [Smittium simulii]|uniref:LSM complex subunit LSM4 n=1 Tax=Smittium simulii TaxID=133385 RepID=A0A2T9YM17_9FUNG|nr:hypothetical protein BB561_003314 [Smittium simulii]